MAPVTAKSATVTTALSSTTNYFWQVTGYTTKYKDSVESEILSFTTLNDDNSGPTITYKNGTSNGSRVQTAAGSIVVSVTDPNGINEVSATLNGIAITGITNAGSDYTIPYNTARFGSNIIVITGKDNSPDHNSNTMTISFVYNTVPSAMTLIGPSDGAQEIDTFPTFKWSGGKDSDGDSVFFKVLYGTTTALGNQTSEFVNTDSIRLTTKLPTNSLQYWKVIGYTKGTFKDTVALGPFSFRTINPDRTTPLINITAPAPYISGMRVTSATNAIAFTASDANGIDSTYYKVNATGTKISITGTGGPYSFSYTLDRRGRDTIYISVVDGSVQHNKTSTQVIVNYNSLLPADITVLTPEDNKTNTTLLPTFSWNALTDADGDAISYRVKFSTDRSLPQGSSMTSDVTGTTVAIGSALAANTPYYYQVIGYTSLPFMDTARSAIRTFTTLPPKPTIKTPPSNQTVVEGSAATFSIEANGSNLTYQWLKNNIPIPSAVTATYPTPPTTLSDNNATFSCIFSNAGGSDTSAAAVLTVTMKAPVITNSPVTITVNEGQPANFYVLAIGSSLHYEWQKDGNPIAGTGDKDSYSLVTSWQDNGASIRCRVYNQGGSVSSQAANLTVFFAPKITRQPANVTSRIGDTTTLSVTAQGNPATLTYQWYLGGNAISGAIYSSYTMNDIKPAQGGTYYVQISNTQGPSRSIDISHTVAMEYRDRRDGEIYKLTQIKGKFYFAENLRFATPDSSWVHPINTTKYGRFYPATRAGIACPPGWHIPDFDTEVSGAIDSGGTANCKAKWPEWNGSTTPANNGFHLLPTGYLNVTEASTDALIGFGMGVNSYDSTSCGSFYFKNFYGNYITAVTETYMEGFISRPPSHTKGASVRCVKD